MKIALQTIALWVMLHAGYAYSQLKALDIPTGYCQALEMQAPRILPFEKVKIDNACADTLFVLNGVKMRYYRGLNARFRGMEEEVNVYKSLYFYCDSTYNDLRQVTLNHMDMLDKSLTGAVSNLEEVQLNVSHSLTQLEAVNRQLDQTVKDLTRVKQKLWWQKMISWIPPFLVGGIVGYLIFNE